jgi:predicted Zn-dependent peptidase
VLAIVGDFAAPAAAQRVAELFGSIAARPATPLPHTVEPPQSGERRIRVTGPGEEKQLKIAWRAPSASSADYAAFLVLQELLGGGSGVSFLQNDWGTPVRQDSLLHGAAESLTSWFPPSAQNYVFLISASAPSNANEATIEADIEQRIAQARDVLPDAGSLAAAVGRIRDQLVFDVETTEDAAHQLAFFDGLGALDTLLELPERLQAVTPGDVRAVARRYLRPEQRTIGWWTPGEEPAAETAVLTLQEKPDARQREPVDLVPVAAPVVSRLSGGMPVIVASSDFSPAAQLRVVIPNSMVGDPVPGYASLDYRFRPGGTQTAGIVSESAAATAGFRETAATTASFDPSTRLEQTMAGIMGGAPRAASHSPALIVVAGDLQAEATIALLETAYGNMQPGKLAPAAKRTRSKADVSVRMGRTLAQAQLGYVMPAAAPGDPEAYAYRILLYILSHDYEGRLGKKAISDSGLVYYIDSRYRSNGDTAWITLATGVDPQKLQPLTALFRSELARLQQDPPTAAEIEEARNHLVGRARSQAQSNEELTARLATQWLWYGRLQSPEELRAKLAQVGDDEVRALAGKFARGTIITVTE